VLALPMPPESSHEWTALTISICLGVLQALAFVALGSRRRGAVLFVYSLGALGFLAAVTHTPMLVHMIRDQEPVGFFAAALVEGLALGMAALLKWQHEHQPFPKAH
jgi:hypothetical protein